jgi:hypothetical protein
MLKIEHLTKTYGEKRAVDDLSLSNFHWTSEIAPIKQSLSAAAALFGGSDIFPAGLS